MPPPSKARFVIGMVVASSLAVAAQQPISVANLNAAEIAALIAARGWSGGIVSALGQSDSTNLSKMRGRQGYEFVANGFRVFMRALQHGPGELIALSGRFHSAAAIHSEFARRNEDFVAARTIGGTEVLRQEGAGFCSAVLRKRLPENVEARDIRDLMARTIRGATGTKVPGGFLGSCIGENEVSASPVFISKGETVEEAFNQIVATFGGAVWVAVQTDANGCSVGLVLKSKVPDTVCLSTIASDIRLEVK